MSLSQSVDDTSLSFLDNLKSGQIATSLFQFLPDVLFWIKDRNGRFIFVNQALCENIGRTEKEILGYTDAEVYSSEMASVFTLDDQQILSSGEPIHNKSELVTSRIGGIEWRSTSKIPVRNDDNQIVGTAGFSRRLEHHEGRPLPGIYQSISRVIETIHDQINENFSVSQLAKEAAMSVSTLERHFKTHLNTTPKRFLIQAKVAAGCHRLLNSGMTVAEVAESLGYQEHASFTRAFTGVMKMSPNAYRNFYRGQRITHGVSTPYLPPTRTKV